MQLASSSLTLVNQTSRETSQLSSILSYPESMKLRFALYTLLSSFALTTSAQETSVATDLQETKRFCDGENIPNSDRRCTHPNRAKLETLKLKPQAREIETENKTNFQNPDLTPFIRKGSGIN